MHIKGLGHGHGSLLQAPEKTLAVPKTKLAVVEKAKKANVKSKAPVKKQEVAKSTAAAKTKALATSKT